MNEQPATAPAPIADFSQLEQALSAAHGSETDVTARIVETASQAIGEVYDSVLTTLDGLQAKIDVLRQRAAQAHLSATDHIRNVVELSADTIRASDTIAAALAKLDAALGIPK